MSDMGDVGGGGYGDWIGGEVGPNAGMPFTPQELELLNSLGVFGDKAAASDIVGGGAGLLGGSPMDWSKLQGTSSGSGSGSTAGAGAGAGYGSTSGLGASSPMSYGASAGITSGGQAPHQIDTPRGNGGSFGAAVSGPAGVVPNTPGFRMWDNFGPRPYINKYDALQQSRDFLPELAYVESKYRNQENPFTPIARQWVTGTGNANQLAKLMRGGR